jgi:hypothetical protein
MGCLPILDMLQLPDLCENLAADPRGARIVAGHDAM